MANKNGTVTNERQIKTFRWLFYISLFQLLACLIFPVIVFPKQVLFHIEMLNALTVGLLFGLYFLGVNIYGMFIDKRRRLIYIGIVAFISVWTIWTIVTWLYIQHMHYLT
jgi:uncharacterized membrane protein